MQAGKLGKPNRGPMQHSPYEIKEKLLQALDHEYNVVDMAAVLEVIAALEKACITKEALEKTRIGRYINELRKRTNNEQLARRAKDLVKSWRKLLPQAPQRINGEEIINSISSSPGPGNRMIKSVSVPGTPRYKTSSPSIMGERSSSPYFSSASNSPLLNSVHQGSSLPSNYAPVKFSQYHVTTRSEKANCVNKTLFSLSNQSKNVTSNQTYDTSLAALRQAINTIKSLSNATYNRISCSPNVSPGLRTNSSSSSTSMSVNLCSQNVSPTLSYSVAHSTLDTAKTNAANKRLRKEINKICSAPKDQILCNSKSRIGNGMSELVKSILPSEDSAFKKMSVFNSKSDESDDIVTNLKTPKRKRSFDKNELLDNRLGDMIASLPSGSKLPKVKTTQQLIADLHAKKGVGSLSPDAISPSIDSLHSSEAEVSRTKSELLKKFLIAQSTRQESNHESPTDESSVSIISDFGSHSVPDISSVINKNFDVSTCISHPNPVDDEINRILSALPPIDPAEIIHEDEDILPNRPTSVTSDDINRLSEPWEYVNGVYDCNGSWRPWKECCEQKSLGESFQLLPYVNID